MDTKRFPSGELNCKFEINNTIYRMNIRDGDDILFLSFLNNFLDSYPLCGAVIEVGYFAYSRQDKVFNEGEPFSLKVICGILNNLTNLNYHILEPHSSVLPALLDRCKVVKMADLIDTTTRLSPFTNKLVVAPDAGAEKRAYEVAAVLGQTKILQAIKKRNPASGQIIKYELFCDDLQGQDCLIVDDICDGGATFLFLAEELRKKNCGKITLFVAHGLFTKGLQVFKDVIDEVYCIEDFQITKKEF